MMTMMTTHSDHGRTPTTAARSDDGYAAATGDATATRRDDGDAAETENATAMETAARSDGDSDDDHDGGGGNATAIRRDRG